MIKPRWLLIANEFAPFKGDNYPILLSKELNKRKTICLFISNKVDFNFSINDTYFFPERTDSEALTLGANIVVSFSNDLFSLNCIRKFNEMGVMTSFIVSNDETPLRNQAMLTEAKYGFTINEELYKKYCRRILASPTPEMINLLEGELHG